jgi:hypothetical protein
MTWKTILGLLIRCEISASRDRLGNIRVSAKGAIAVIIVGVLLVSLASRHQQFPDRARLAPTARGHHAESSNR